MKKILIPICILLFVGCTYNKTPLSKSQKDSIENKRTDSIQNRNRIDSISSINAWGDLKFGMSKKEALKTNALKNGDVFSNYISMEYDNRNEFEKIFGLKQMYDFVALFDENELTDIRISSLDVDADHIDDLISDCSIFAENFTAKGMSSKNIIGNIDISSFNNGEEFTYASFNVGSKYIFIKMGQTDDTDEFYYKISISNYEYPKKQHKPTKQELQDERNQMIKEKEIKDNSF